MKNTQYTLLVLEAYEDEVAGATYFDGLALAFPQRSSFFQKCAALERTTAERLVELLGKYQLTPSARKPHSKSAAHFTLASRPPETGGR